MKRTKDLPDKLRPYRFHGVELDYAEGHENAEGRCPNCDRDDKFAIHSATGQYNCFRGSCGFKGNVTTFLQWLWGEGDRATTPEQYGQLAADRRLLYPDTLMAWGVVRNVLTGDWLMPGWTADVKLYQLYRYTQIRTRQGSLRKALLATPGLKHQLFGVNVYAPEKSQLYLTEGPWDAMVLWEVLKNTKEVESGLSPTANITRSLLADANVLAVPGCRVFSDKWLPLFAGKVVYLMYDNDHPQGGSPPAGYAGMHTVASLLTAAPQPPEAVNYLHWGHNGYDATLPSGFDVRDTLTIGLPQT